VERDGWRFAGHWAGSKKALALYMLYRKNLRIMVVGSVIIFLALSLVIKKMESGSGGVKSFVINVQGRERNYLVYVPGKNLLAAKIKYPIVIALHGVGGPMGDARMMMDVSGWNEKAEKDNFLAVFPEGTPRDMSKPVDFKVNSLEWNDGSGRSYAEQAGIDDVAFISAVIDDLSEKFHVDEEKIFVTGFSGGASMAFRVGAELAGRISAIAPVAGVLSVSPSGSNPPVPLLYISGSEDKRPEIPFRENHKISKDPVVVWAKVLQCPDRPEISWQGSDIKISRYAPCRNNAEVVVYTVQGMGHVYPGAKTELWKNGADNPANDFLDATDTIWDFFIKR
jgi:polyhydroxybutyrate depolymerase